MGKSRISIASSIASMTGGGRLTCSTSAMAPDGKGGIWALAANTRSSGEQIWHRHGTTWSQVKPAFGKHSWVLAALALVPRTHSLWGVGALRAGTSGANGLIAVDGTLPR